VTVGSTPALNRKFEDVEVIDCDPFDTHEEDSGCKLGRIWDLAILRPLGLYTFVFL